MHNPYAPKPMPLVAFPSARAADAPLPDRSSFMQLLGWELRRGARYRRTFTLLRVAADPRGLEVAPTGAFDDGTAAAMRGALRDVDVVARMEAGEFAVLLPETSVALVSPVLQRIIDALVQAATAGAWPVTFSVGAVTWKEADVTPEYLLTRSGELLAHARQDNSRVVEHEVLV